jgi:hypothetical protein
MGIIMFWQKKWKTNVPQGDIEFASIGNWKLIISPLNFMFFFLKILKLL